MRFLSFLSLSALAAALTSGPALAATVTLTSPNGNELWVAKSSHAITWQYAGAANQEVLLSLWEGPIQNQTKVGNIATVSAPAGTYLWEVGKLENAPNAGAGAKYTVKVKVVGLAVSDRSNGLFAIAPRYQVGQADPGAVSPPPPRVGVAGPGNVVSLDPIQSVKTDPGFNEVGFEIKSSPKAFLRVNLHEGPVPAGRECDPTYLPFRGAVSGGSVDFWSKTLDKLAQNTTYHWEVCAKTSKGDFRKAGTVKTIPGTLRVMFDRIQVTDDGDDTSAGDLTFYFKVDKQPHQIRSQVIDTGQTMHPSVFFDVDGAPSSVRIWVRGQDEDCTGFFLEPSDCGYAEYGEVKRTIDLTSMVGTKVVSYSAEHHGVGFTLFVTIKIYGK